MHDKRNYKMTLEERNQKVRAFFNGKIDTYDDVHSEYMKTKVLLADNLDKNAKKILDLGGGTGLELIHLFELFPQAQVTVIDITENMLQKLKTRNFASQVTTICGDFLKFHSVKILTLLLRLRRFIILRKMKKSGFSKRF